MDLIFRQRAIQKKAEAFYQAWFGVATETDKVEREYTVAELIEATRRAQYNRILDILDNGYDSISPNDEDDDGDSAFSTALMMVLCNEQNESDEDDTIDDLTFWQRIKLKFSRKSRLMQLDLIVSIFLYKGGDVNFIRSDKSFDGYAIMHHAAQKGSIEMIKWLLSKKANINIKTSVKQTTPLMLAAAGGHIDVVMYLLRNGAIISINYADNRGMTALHFCAIHSTPDLAQVLLICGANKSLRSKDNRLPAEEAKSRNRIEMQVKIQQYIPPFTMREEKMVYFEKLYGIEPDENDIEESTAMDTSLASIN